MLGSLATASVLYALGSFVAKGSKFLLIPLYVRLLTPEEVGILVLAEAIAAAFSRLFSAGLGQAVKRFYVEFDDSRSADAYSAGVFWVGLAIASVGAAGLGLGVAVWGESLTRQMAPYYLLLALVIGALQSNFNVPLQRYVARQDPLRHTALTVLPFLTSAALVIGLVVAGYGIEGVLWGQIVSFAVWNGIVALTMLTPTRPRFDRAELVGAIRYSAPALPHLLFAWGITFADRLILERFVTLGDVGVYGMGYQLASVVPIVSLALINAWIPRYFRTGTSAVGRREFERTATWVFAVIVATALALFLFAPEVVRVVLTEAYAGSSEVMRLVTLGLVFHGLYQALLLPLYLSKKTGWVSLATGAAFVSNVALNLALVPAFGIVAAAWATVLSYGAAAVLTWGVARRHYPSRFDLGRMSRIAAWTVAVGLAGVTWGDGPSLAATAVKVGLLALYAGGLAYLPGLLEPDERAALGRWIGRTARRAFGGER